jgi:hypothetical protein
MEIIHHTWYNKHAHIFRKDGRVVRAVLKQLVIGQDGIYLTVSFLTRGQIVKTKQTSPITVAALQVLWMNVDVVSDVETPMDTDNDDTFIPPPECDRLPPLAIGGVSLTSEINCLLMQVNNFLRLAGDMAIPTILQPMPNAPSPVPTPILTPILAPTPSRSQPSFRRVRGTATSRVRREVARRHTRRDIPGGSGGP